ncbi:hypothetical protein B0H34DRAFT_692705 [Crassisporium funariophilum]|nr:hypothetical protein B0H34DRAFT_692705 [Crassisporium funariophilum]
MRQDASRRTRVVLLVCMKRLLSTRVLLVHALALCMSPKCPLCAHLCQTKVSYRPAPFSRNYFEPPGVLRYRRYDSENSGTAASICVQISSREGEGEGEGESRCRKQRGARMISSRLTGELGYLTISMIRAPNSLTIRSRFHLERYMSPECG